MLKFRWETEFKQTEIGEIPQDWEIKKLGDIITKAKNGGTPSTRNPEFWNGEIPWITSNHLDSLYVTSGERFVTKKAILKKKTAMANKGVLLIATRVGIGKVSIAGVDLAFNQDVTALWINKNTNIEYLARTLRSQVYNEILQNLADGTTVGGITRDALLSLKIPYPLPSEQSRIATVLSWFDDLIENKKKQNEILEKTAMAIFKSWFIDFEPFKDEEFVYNEELGREIPRGWEVKKLKDFVNLAIVGSTPLRRTNKYWKNGNIPWLTNKEIKEGTINFVFDTGEKVSEIAIDETNLKVVPENSLIISFTASVGKIAINKIPITTNQQFISFTLKDGAFLYYLSMYFLIFNEIFEAYSGATPFNFITKDVALSLPVLAPPQSVLEKFHSLVEPLFQKIINNQKEIMVLRKIRDALLPLLVFGKLRVKVI